MKPTQVFVELLFATSVAGVVLPSQDLFYSQPSNVSSYAPGAVINSRTIPTNLNGLVPNASNISVEASYQYLYRTTDSLGNAVAAVTTLLVPHKADSSKLLAYQIAYDSANNNCSPSYALQAGANTSTSLEVIFLTAALDQGWYVVTSDYEGLQAQYTVGAQAGYATLDSVRAVFNAASTSGLKSNARYAMWGYSGGALASEWAAELQPSYAPELNFEGAALGGLIPNTSSVLATINKGSSSGLAFSGIFGLTKAYANMSAWFEQSIVESKKAQFESIANGCLSQASAAGGNMDLYSYFTRGQQSLYDAVPQTVFEESGVMGRHGTPKMPLFIYKAVADEVSPSKDTDELVSYYCSKKDACVNIEYHRDLVGTHVSEAITGSASAFDWLADRLNGKAVVNEGCTMKTVELTSIDQPTIVKLGEEFLALFQVLLGGRLGPPTSG